MNDYIMGNRVAIIILGVFILIDIITGVLKALYEGNYSSSIFRHGIIKKLMEIITCIVAFCLDILLGLQEIGKLTVVGLCANEAYSIVIENIGNYITLPKVLKSYIDKNRENIDDDDIL